jgi:hypothetical protein
MSDASTVLTQVSPDLSITVPRSSTARCVSFSTRHDGEWRSFSVESKIVSTMSKIDAAFKRAVIISKFGEVDRTRPRETDRLRQAMNHGRPIDPPTIVADPFHSPRDPLRGARLAASKLIS